VSNVLAFLFLSTTSHKLLIRIRLGSTGSEVAHGHRNCNSSFLILISLWPQQCPALDGNRFICLTLASSYTTQCAVLCSYLGNIFTINPECTRGLGN
jgi:hypothetical protein